MLFISLLFFFVFFFSLSHIIIIHSPKYIPFQSECSCQISLSIPFSLFISHLNSILEFNCKLSHLYHITFFINLSIFFFGSITITWHQIKSDQNLMPFFCSLFNVLLLKSIHSFILFYCLYFIYLNKSPLNFYFILNFWHFISWEVRWLFLHFHIPFELQRKLPHVCDSHLMRLASDSCVLEYDRRFLPCGYWWKHSQQ